MLGTIRNRPVYVSTQFYDGSRRSAMDECPAFDGDIRFAYIAAG